MWVRACQVVKETDVCRWRLNFELRTGEKIKVKAVFRRHKSSIRLICIPNPARLKLDPGDKHIFFNISPQQGFMSNTLRFCCVGSENNSIHNCKKRATEEFQCKG